MLCVPVEGKHRRYMDLTSTFPVYIYHLVFRCMFLMFSSCPTFITRWYLSQCHAYRSLYLYCLNPSLALFTLWCSKIRVTFLFKAACSDTSIFNLFLLGSRRPNLCWYKRVRHDKIRTKVHKTIGEQRFYWWDGKKVCLKNSSGCLIGWNLY